MKFKTNMPLNVTPDFIVIGAMKCGTSTLHDQLNMHRSFFMTTPKEPNFFSNDEIFCRGSNWYESLFFGAAQGQLRGESSTHYTKLPTYPDTIKRLAVYCPNAKFIYLMRNPFDRLVSHYIHEWTQRVINCNIDIAVERFPELMEYGRYAKQLQPYISTFGYSSVLPVFLERIKTNPNRELQRIFDFLNVDETPLWRSEIMQNVSSERLRTSAWRDAIVNQPYLKYFRRNFIPKSIRSMIKNFWRIKDRPKLSKDTFDKMKNHFNADLKILGSMLGIDLRCDNFNEQILSQDHIFWKNL